MRPDAPDSGTTPEAPTTPSDVVELRVHGVAGTPPEELLDRPLVRRVAGNATAGFYRPRLASERTDDPPGGGRGAYLEGYSWGGLTSGAPSRVLWLLLLPFTLVNVAPRFRPPSGEPTWAVRGLWGTTRVVALSLTAGLALAAAGVGTDLFGWQCGALPEGTCQGAPAGLMRWVAHLDAGGRLAVGAVVPLLVLALLALVSQRTAARYEAFAPRAFPEVGAAGPDAGARSFDPDDPDPDLGHPALWYGLHPVRRLRHLHLQVGVVTIAGTAVAPVRSPFVGTVLAGVATVLVLAGVLASSSAVAGRRADVDALRRAPAALWWLTLGVAAGATVVLLTTHGVVTGPSRALPGYTVTVTVFFAGQTVAVLAVGVCVLALRRSGPPRAPFGGFATVVVAAVALLVAGAFSAGAYVLAAAWLRAGSLRPSYAAVREALGVFDIPQPMLIGAVSFAVISAWALAVFLGVAAWVAYRLLRIRRWRAGTAVLPVEYPDEPDRTADRDAQILRVWWGARLVDRVGGLVGVFLGPVVAFAVATAVVVALQYRVGAADRLLAAVTGAADLVAAGAFGVVGFLGLFISLGAVALRVAATRRLLGILWDLASFWPRTVHPFAAPCYSERTLADLLTRVRWYVSGDHPSDYPTGAVVLAGHSQGSVMTAALLAQLATADELHRDGPPVLPHVAFLTYGCVLRRLYARYFPAYFGPASLDQVRAALTTEPQQCRWRDLWRRSDHLGGAVDSDPWEAMDPHLPARGPTDVRLVDPPYSQPGDLTPPPARRHSSYSEDPAFQAAVEELSALLPRGQVPIERQGRPRSWAT